MRIEFMRRTYTNSNTIRKPGAESNGNTAPLPAGSPQSAPNQQGIIPEFIQALADEIEKLKKGGGGSIITVFDGYFIRQEGPFYVYVFTTESPLIVMDDAPAEVEVGGQRFEGQVISVQGSEVAVGVVNDFGKTIAQARLITNLWYLLEALRKRFEEVNNGQRTLATRLGQSLFGFAAANVGSDTSELNLPASVSSLNDEQLAAIRSACGSDIHFIWGPPGTGKTKTIGFLIAAFIRRNLRVLVASHTNVATDYAITSAAKLLEDTEDYQSGKLVRFGNISPNVSVPEMVIPEKIAERLGHDLKAQILRLQNELVPIKEELTALRAVEALQTQMKEQGHMLEHLNANHRKCLQEHESSKSRANNLATQVQVIETKIAEAESAGRFRRFLRGLDPVALQAQLLRTGTELNAVRASIAASTRKLAEFHSRIEAAQRLERQIRQEQDALLFRFKLTLDAVSSRITRLAKQSDELSVKIRTIEAELDAIAAKILKEAKLVATSLTKATISKQIDGQLFDVLVVDEASMAPMPSLFYATGRASQKVIVVGDFRQLPPICVAESPIAQKWLARDIFEQAGIQRAVDEQKPEPRLTMLKRQYRMHPDISAISNSIIYGGQLHDSLGKAELKSLAAFHRQSPFAPTPLVLYDVSATNPWSSKLEQGGRYNLYSAVLSAELAKRAALAGCDSIGIISPYSVHARLIKMILDDSGDAQLRHLRVSTVHRFQGLEQDAIIFDIAEGPMPRFGPSGLVDGSDLASQAAKLINVSITRPKAQLVVVANCDYLASKLRRDSILIRVLEQMRQNGTVIDSRQVVTDYFCSDYERWAALLNPHDDRIDPADSTLYTAHNFYAAFFTDLRKATREIIIVSPFLTANRAQQFFDLLRSKIALGVAVRVFTQTVRDGTGEMSRQAEMVIGGLKQINVQIVERKGLHQKFAFIDRKVAWEGSLNILSQSSGRTTEHMRRLPFATTCDELIKLHQLGSDAEVEPGSRGKIRTDRQCEVHHTPMVLVPGPYGLFLGCQEYPHCNIHYRIGQSDRIKTDANCPGKDGVACDQTMFAVRGRYGVYLKCLSPGCNGTQKIAT
jgi:hypothetical protein